MTNIVITIIYGITIGLALSVDAFMLALVFGTTFRRKREALFSSFLVGLFHFIMPLTGYLLASLVFKQINLTSILANNIQFIAFIILVMIGLMMIFKKESSEDFNICKLINKFLFAFSVSIDGFLTGIAFTTVDHINIFLTCIIFSIVSFALTYLALSIGKNTADKLMHSNLDFYAGILMIILAAITLFI